MNEQERREKVINGLHKTIDAIHSFVPNQYWYDTETPCDDAIALLKAQEPHVIRFDEIDDYEVLWLEVRDVGTEEGLAPWVKTRSGNWFSPLLCSELQPDMILSTPEEYGKYCRCWTSRPTDKQRREAEWE